MQQFHPAIAKFSIVVFNMPHTFGIPVEFNMSHTFGDPVD